MSDSTVFIVRVWRSDSFRAAARPVDDDRTIVFCEPAELLRFLVPNADASSPSHSQPVDSADRLCANLKEKP